MSFKVVTKEDGFIVLPDGDEIYVEEGTLRVDNLSGDNVAVFAAGQWVYAYVIIEAEEVTTSAEPRVWQSLADVPRGTKVDSCKQSLVDGERLKIRITDFGNSQYRWRDSDAWSKNWFRLGELAGADRSYAPFTEVLS